MALKQFPNDFPDITFDGQYILAVKQDGTIGKISLQSIISYNRAGNVGVGTNSPTQKLDINGSVQISGNLISTDGSVVGVNAIAKNPDNNNSVQLLTTFSPNANALVSTNSNESAPKNLLINPNGGNVGLNINSTPQQALHVGGNILASGTITPGSDKRLKKSINTLTGGAVELINQLRPVTYTLKEDDAKSMGFIADEVRKVFPYLVLEGTDDDKMLAMNYMGLTAPIVKAIQEMSATIIQLQERISVLESK